MLNILHLFPLSKSKTTTEKLLKSLVSMYAWIECFYPPELVMSSLLPPNQAIRLVIFRVSTDLES